MNTVALPRVLASCLVFAAFAGVSHQAQADATADTACRIHVTSAPSDFPLEAQKQAEHGVVRLTVSIDATGRAQTVTTLRSSGYPRLDEAANASVLKEWRFDVSACSNGGFPVVKQIEVEYRKAPLVTVYGTRSAHWATLLASARANPACATRFDSTTHNGDFSVACVEPRGTARESLAQAAAATRQ
jgi:TonB family protein